MTDDAYACQMYHQPFSEKNKMLDTNLFILLFPEEGYD